MGSLSFVPSTSGSEFATVAIGQLATHDRHERDFGLRREQAIVVSGDGSAGGEPFGGVTLAFLLNGGLFARLLAVSIQ
jgi:hypothetical protein